jgi:hypothetical protein
LLDSLGVHVVAGQGVALEVEPQSPLDVLGHDEDVRERGNRHRRRQRLAPLLEVVLVQLLREVGVGEFGIGAKKPVFSVEGDGFNQPVITSQSQPLRKTAPPAGTSV